MTRRVLIGFAIMLQSIACSDTATITRRDKPPVEARIVEADEKAVYVDLPLVQSVHSIPHSDVIDIDHPGNVHLVIGSISTFFGVVLGAASIPLFFSDDPYAFVIGIPVAFSSAVYLAVGVPLGWWGLTTYFRSRRNAEHEARAEPVVRLRLVPVVTNEKRTSAFGVGMTGTF